MPQRATVRLAAECARPQVALAAAPPRRAAARSRQGASPPPARARPPSGGGLSFGPLPLGAPTAMLSRRAQSMRGSAGVICAAISGSCTPGCMPHARKCYFHCQGVVMHRPCACQPAGRLLARGTVRLLQPRQASDMRVCMRRAGSHAGAVRVTNTGRFLVKTALSLRHPQPPPPPSAVAAPAHPEPLPRAAPKPGAKSKAAVAAAPPPRPPTPPPPVFTLAVAVRHVMLGLHVMPGSMLYEWVCEACTRVTSVADGRPWDAQHCGVMMCCTVSEHADRWARAQELELAVGETREVLITAAPSVLGPATATLLCAVAGNPAPAELAVSCVGAQPRLELSIVPEAAPSAGAACGVQRLRQHMRQHVRRAARGRMHARPPHHADSLSWCQAAALMLRKARRQRRPQRPAGAGARCAPRQRWRRRRPRPRTVLQGGQRARAPLRSRALPPPRLPGRAQRARTRSPRPQRAQGCHQDEARLLRWPLSRMQPLGAQRRRPPRTSQALLQALPRGLQGRLQLAPLHPATSGRAHPRRPQRGSRVRLRRPGRALQPMRAQLRRLSPRARALAAAAPRCAQAAPPERAHSAWAARAALMAAPKLRGPPCSPPACWQEAPS